MSIKRIVYTKTYQTLYNGIWKNNPVFSMVLGLCSSLAVTNKVENGLAMGLGVTFVLVASNMFISLIRSFIPSKLRMIAYMIIISTFVIIADQYLKGFYPLISAALGPYLALIITNCIIMGRAEAFADKNSVLISIVDGFANSVGYTVILVLMSVIRESMAFGTILNYRVAPAWWTNWVIMAIAPGAFFVLAIILWITRIKARVCQI